MAAAKHLNSFLLSSCLKSYGVIDVYAIEDKFLFTISENSTINRHTYMGGGFRVVRFPDLFYVREKVKQVITGGSRKLLADFVFLFKNRISSIFFI